MTTNRRPFYSLFPFVLLALIVPTLVCALPPTEVTSAYDVMIKLEYKGSNYYRFSTGGYDYYILWDSGPTYLKIHGILGYDAEGNVIDYTHAQVFAEGIPAPDAQLSFKGVGNVRCASTNSFQIPASIYLNNDIQHIAVDFSVVDGRMTVGPWLPMTGDWENASSVREHLTLLIW